MKKKENNYAFIDAQNVHLGIKLLGWNLDWVKFRVHLKEKYNINFKVAKQKNYWYLKISSKKEVNAFIEIVRPYVNKINVMKYKVEMEKNNE